MMMIDDLIVDNRWFSKLMIDDDDDNYDDGRWGW